MVQSVKGTKKWQNTYINNIYKDIFFLKGCVIQGQVVHSSGIENMKKDNTKNINVKYFIFISISAKRIFCQVNMKL